MSLRFIYLQSNIFMKYKYLAITPLFLFGSVYAQDANNGLSLMPATEVAYPAVSATLPEDVIAEAPKVTMNEAVSKPAPFRTRGVRGTTYQALELGYMKSNADIRGGGGKGEGVGFRFEYGYKRLIRARISTRYNFFSFGLSIANFMQNERFTSVALPLPLTIRYGFVTLGLPLSYCSITNKRATGYYWQIGANVNTPLSANYDKKALIKDFAPIYVEPLISIGKSFQYAHNDKPFTMLVGPYASYTATNFAKEGTAVHMRIVTFGIRFSAVLL